MDILGYHLPSHAAAVAAFAAVLAAFTRFDKDQSDDNRKFVRDWLQGLKVDNRQWTTFFTNLFENFFGSKHLSMKCVRRSFGLSVILIVTILATWAIRIQIDFHSFQNAAGLVGLVSALVAFGCIADYLSLWKTRFLLTKSNMLRSWPTAAIVVLGDFMATTLTYIVFFMISSVIFSVIFLMTTGGLSQLPQTLDELRRIPGALVSVSPLTLLWFAALLTSAWLWVYLVVAYAMRAASYLPKSFRPLSMIMDFENHPVRTIGYVAAMVSAVIVEVFSLI